MTSSRFLFFIGAGASALLLLSACATGAGSASGRPDLYPNAALNRVGDAIFETFFAMRPLGSAS